ncbi:hypothetical protein FQN54_005446 [Arachnomyces sp. PD_36]|nr:hypothetical protein FQN54_005446 [Arachnomyces sp. PD_36]
MAVDPIPLIGAVLVLVSVSYLATNKEARNLLIERVTSTRRKVSSAGSPPPSLDFEKKPQGSQASTAAYPDVLPPLRREALLKVAEALPAERKKVIRRDITEKDVLASSLPLTADYNTSDGNKYTATGFSVDEIKALGDFPDYAELSGVPPPEEYSEFDLEKAIPRPYRPFRWSYHQTMSLTKLDSDWWIEIEGQYKERIEHRKGLYAKNGKSILDYLPGSELACKELMEMVLQFICIRYPKHFSLSEDKRYFNNGILGIQEDLKTKHPLHVLLDNVPEDFAIMLRDPETGDYFLRAGVICSSLGWSLSSKLGLRLHDIHGPIPDYKEKMQFSMGRYFSKMPTDRPIQRGSWGLEVEKPLYMPPGDPHELHRLSQSPNLKLNDCHLRVDWQTLRRLPLSASIIFNFKGLFTPVTEFRDEPGIPKIVAKVLREGKESIMEYKNTWHVHHVVLPALDEWIEEQEENGLVEKGWEVSTLDDSPYYKGWEEKWHRQQGF